MSSELPVVLTMNALGLLEFLEDLSPIQIGTQRERLSSIEFLVRLGGTRYTPHCPFTHVLASGTSNFVKDLVFFRPDADLWLLSANSFNSLGEIIGKRSIATVRLTGSRSLPSSLWSVVLSAGVSTVSATGVESVSARG